MEQDIEETLILAIERDADEKVAIDNVSMALKNAVSAAEAKLFVEKMMDYCENSSFGENDAMMKKAETEQSVAEQVEMVCKAATSVDNLAQLYEGWAAWV